MDELVIIAKQLVAVPKGILAADESLPTIEKRFASFNIVSTPQTHRAYRQLLFTTAEIENYISGVILFDETVRQKTSDGIFFPQYLLRRGILPGVKVDLGTVPFNESEKVTQGIEGLEERLKEYKELRLTFTKWRAVFSIGNSLPTDECIYENAKRLAIFAQKSQAYGLVPIVEPEVLMEGNHSQDACESATSRVLSEVFQQLKIAGIVLDGMLLKPNMVLSGLDFPQHVNANKIANATFKILKKIVPTKVAGIVFLSGGQTPDEATQNLMEINRINDTVFPLSFSFGRALQQEALSTWCGKDENKAAAQTAFLNRCKKVSSARKVNSVL